MPGEGSLHHISSASTRFRRGCRGTAPRQPCCQRTGDGSLAGPRSASFLSLEGAPSTRHSEPPAAGARAEQEVNGHPSKRRTLCRLCLCSLLPLQAVSPGQKQGSPPDLRAQGGGEEGGEGGRRGRRKGRWGGGRSILCCFPAGLGAMGRDSPVNCLHSSLRPSPPTLKVPATADSLHLEK